MIFTDYYSYLLEKFTIISEFYVFLYNKIPQVIQIEIGRMHFYKGSFENGISVLNSLIIEIFENLQLIEEENQVSGCENGEDQYINLYTLYATDSDIREHKYFKNIYEKIHLFKK